MRAQLTLKEDLEKSENLIGYSYYVIDNPKTAPSHILQRQLTDEGSEVAGDIAFENMPMLAPLSIVPLEELYGFQWSMVRIQAGELAPGTPGTITGWDLHKGRSDIIICILDSGCDLTHPDLRFANSGLRLPVQIDSWFITGAPNPTAMGFHVAHGTACAGIAAGTIDNLKGVAGLAGRCTILPFAFTNATDFEVAHGISFAIGKANVINMSFNSNAWDVSVINPSIEAAYNNNLIMVASTGGHIGSPGGPLIYPATHPRVIACGASDLNDNATGFSNFGSSISVVAPGIDIMTTDIQGAGGYNPGSDYTFFSGTSAAAPHVAGLAALLLSADRTLSSGEVRDIIEQTADKVGPHAYTPDPFGNPNKSWNQYLGYGRINVLRALEMALARRAGRDVRDAVDVHRSFALVRSTPKVGVHLEQLRKSLRGHEAALARLETETSIHRILLHLGQDAGVLRLINEMYEKPEIIEEFRADADSILRSGGIALPEGVTVSVVDEPRPTVRAEFSIGGRKFFAQWDPDLGFSSFAEISRSRTRYDGTATTVLLLLGVAERTVMARPSIGKGARGPSTAT